MVYVDDIYSSYRQDMLHRQIHSGSDDYLKWQSSVIGSYLQCQVKEPQGR